MRRRSRHLLGRTAAALAAAVILPNLPGFAAGAATAGQAPSPPTGRTYVVNSTADSVDADVGAAACADVHHKCSLRAAIMQANFHAGADIIKIPAGTYTLTRKGDDDQDILGDLDVTDSLTLEGAGATKTIINGNGAVTQDRVMEIMPTALDTTISGLTLRNGRQVLTFGTGGGLLWNGGGSRLTIRNVIVSDSEAYDAGGVALEYSASGDDTVDLEHFTVEHNTATAAVGGLLASVGSFGAFLLRNSVIHANRAYEGAGLYLQGPTSGADPTSMVVENTALTFNHARGLSGGLENRAGTPAVPVDVVNSYFHGNVADIQGGGIGNFADLQVDQSTLEGNTSVLGGGIYDYEGAVAMFTNSTLGHNSASNQGGGVYVEFFQQGKADVVLRNSTLSGNSAATGGGIYISPGAMGGLSNTLLAKGASGANCSGNMAGQTSLSDDNSCGFGGGADGVDLKLGPIGAHGGLTRTLVPEAGSPALDAGTVPGEPVIDQRGVARPMGAGLDIGAVEVCPQAPAGPTTLKATRRTAKSRRLTLSWKEAGCFETYSVHLRQKSTKGKVVQSTTGLITPTLQTKKLVKGRTYFWRVNVIGDRGTALSTWHHFRVK